MAVIKALGQAWLRLATNRNMAGRLAGFDPKRTLKELFSRFLTTCQPLFYHDGYYIGSFRPADNVAVLFSQIS
ncbi:MAG TPA: hypothetical protein VJL82_03845 [Rhizomicrobium sp.]|nr:hypothetical protein [Rhizomicrobium sp.]